MNDKLVFDDGLLHLDVNGNGELVFNPSDFNLYQRFCAFLQELPQIENKYRDEVEKPRDPGSEKELIELAGRELDRAKEIDADIKGRLSSGFGSGNDFDKLLGGVNLMAFGSNGKRVLANLLDALTPYLEKGAKQHMRDAASDAVADAKKRRAARGAKK